MANKIKSLVSKKKRRFQEDGFDLDMTFITPRIVAMGFPAEKIEGVYRNNIKDVKRYFDGKYKDHYKVYNLCSERDYDPSKFYNRVAKFPFDDHNAPPFALMEPFCKSVAEYLDADERNVALIHCKAGKGRTGVMIVAYMLDQGQYTDTQTALDYYGHKRTTNGKGVTIPSQVRYVHYYGKYVRDAKPYKQMTLMMKSVKLVGIPMFKDGTCIPQFTLRQGSGKSLIFKSGWYEGIQKDQKEALLELQPATPVCEDIKMEFIHKGNMGGNVKMFHLWFNTFFIEDYKMVATKPQIDKAHKDKRHKLFPKDFRVEIYFESPEEKDGSSGGAAADAEKGTVMTPEVKGDSLAAASAVGDATAEKDATAGDVPAPVTPGKSKERLNRRVSSTMNEMTLWSDSDLTDDDDEEEEDFEGMPITDV